MTEKYIILQRPKLRVPLWATDQSWIAKVSDIKQYSIDIFMEALFVSLIYDSGRPQDISAYLAQYDKQIGPGVVEQFIQFFKYTHPGIPLDVVSYRDIQLLANEQGCSIPIYKYNFTISANDEKKLVDAIIKFPDKIWERVGFYMSSERKKYALEFYPKLGQEQDDILLANFLRIHGVSYAAIQKSALDQLPPNMKYAPIWSLVIFIGYVAIFVICIFHMKYFLAILVLALGTIWNVKRMLAYRNYKILYDQIKRQRH